MASYKQQQHLQAHRKRERNSGLTETSRGVEPQTVQGSQRSEEEAALAGRGRNGTSPPQPQCSWVRDGHTQGREPAEREGGYFGLKRQKQAPERSVI